MNLDQLQIDARPRPYAQAIDLGSALLREHARTVYLTWWAIWLPLGALVALLSPQSLLVWNWLLLWWLRPLIERSTIFILSRAVFGEQVSVKQALRAWPSLLRLGWLRSLTWWRPIMVGRGLYQPVWVLEGARGDLANLRRRVLGARGAYGSAAWFGVICAHFEFILQFALISLLGIFLSSAEQINPFLLLQDEFASGRWENHLPLLTYLFSAGIIGPYYAASCFTLYLNRRAELEGWDIEIALRKLARRRSSQLVPATAKAAGTTISKMLGLLLASMLAFTLPSPPAEAAADCSKLKRPDQHAASRSDSATPEQRRLRESIDQLAGSEEFSQWECVEGWQRKPEKPEKEEKDDRDWSWLKKLLGADGPNLPVADILKPVFIAMLIILVVWLLFRNRKLLGGLLKSDKDEEGFVPAEEICGLDIRPESLPADIPASVLALWRDGQQRAALALLYRASVSRLAHRHALELAAGFTEGDCQQAARAAVRNGQLSAEAGDHFTELTRIWQAAAYADRWPETATLELLCQRWRQLHGSGQ